MYLEKESFFENFNINRNKFENMGFNWDELMEIYEHYLTLQGEMEKVSNHVFNMLIDLDKVHSIRKRVKDPAHLLEKIIRKSIEKEKIITVENYEDVITDLIGIRVLHLFKEDWEIIHKNILKMWELKENPTANIKKGDNIQIYEKFDCQIKEHEFGYRSIHYLVDFPFMKDITYTVEIQVRTLFEEAWSEIDHTIRYPYDIDNPILAGYLVMFNTLSGNADEMGTFIKFLKRELDERKRKMSEQDRTIMILRSQIDKLEIEHQSKENLLESIDSILPDKEYDTYNDFINSIDWMPSIGSILKLNPEVIENLSKISKNIAETIDEKGLLPVFENMYSDVAKIAKELSKNSQTRPIKNVSELKESYPDLSSEAADTIKAIVNMSLEKDKIETKNSELADKEKKENKKKL